MTLRNRLLREYHHWSEDPLDRSRWWIRHRHNPLAQQKFRFGEHEFSYFIHPYNHTWANERAVEIPVAQHFVGSTEPSLVLEIGNVLSHYFDVGHTVVDLYERCRFRAIINEDLIDFNPPQKYSSIVSISTIEHVGWDDKPRNPPKIFMAFEKIRSLLSPSGQALVSVPVGQNPFLDEQLRAYAIGESQFRCLKRISGDNQWAEADLADALSARYGHPYKYANSVVFIYLRPGESN